MYLNKTVQFVPISKSLDHICYSRPTLFYFNTWSKAVLSSASKTTFLAHCPPSEATAITIVEKRKKIRILQVELTLTHSRNLIQIRLNTNTRRWYYSTSEIGLHQNLLKLPTSLRKYRSSALACTENVWCLTNILYEILLNFCPLMSGIWPYPLIVVPEVMNRIWSQLPRLGSVVLPFGNLFCIVILYK